ncbi:hypothetical protein C8J30_1141 [Rhodobacter viridis]|uniref:Uncharacterized protein n=1 Tax=Rhodobacter viridis TaxID=1054202 RepID=A0A318TT99_9RHOB|nr:hypothetical protein [Rhodobacter viridis]PYF08066.1 hypothetical protein C8J30_1141 [Rhodobacter viridis]
MIYHRYAFDSDPFDDLAEHLEQVPILADAVLGIGAPGCVARFQNHSDQNLFYLACDENWLPHIERHGLDLVLPVDLPFGLATINSVIEQCSLHSRVNLLELYDIGFYSESDHEDFLMTVNGHAETVRCYPLEICDAVAE